MSHLTHARRVFLALDGGYPVILYDGVPRHVDRYVTSPLLNIYNHTVNSPMIKNVDMVALAGLPTFSQCSWCLPVGLCLRPKVNSCCCPTLVSRLLLCQRDSTPGAPQKLEHSDIGT